MQNSVESRVKNIIVKQLGVKAEDLSLDKTIIDDLGADSLDAVEVVMALEEEFGLEIPEERASSLRTVGDAITYINDNAQA